MSSIRLVDPFRCRMWALHDRLDCHISEETCRLEIQSFLKHGQFVPVLARTLRSDLTHDLELIFGARRLFVARHVNKPLAVEVRELSDREAIIAMDIENRQRKDVSPYERGRSYSRWLQSKHFGSQEEIARALNVSASQISRLLRLARLPSVIVGAFGSAADICENWGLELIDIWEDPARRQALAHTARRISALSQRPNARDVYQQLLSGAVPGRKVRHKPRDEVVLDSRGAPLFRVRRQVASIALLLPAGQVSAVAMERIRQTVKGILEEPPVSRAEILHAGSARSAHSAHTERNEFVTAAR